MNCIFKSDWYRKSHCSLGYVMTQNRAESYRMGREESWIHYTFTWILWNNITLIQQKLACACNWTHVRDTNFAVYSELYAFSFIWNDLKEYCSLQELLRSILKPFEAKQLWNKDVVTCLVLCHALHLDPCIGPNKHVTFLPLVDFTFKQ